MPKFCPSLLKFLVHLRFEVGARNRQFLSLLESHVIQRCLDTRGQLHFVGLEVLLQRPLQLPIKGRALHFQLLLGMRPGGGQRDAVKLTLLFPEALQLCVAMLLPPLLQPDLMSLFERMAMLREALHSFPFQRRLFCSEGSPLTLAQTFVVDHLFFSLVRPQRLRPPELFLCSGREHRVLPGTGSQSGIAVRDCLGKGKGGHVHALHR